MIRNFLVCAAALCAFASSAVPAMRGVRTLTQPDGSAIHLTLVGDEHNHYYLTEDNQIVLNRGGAYYFAEIDRQGLARPSDVLASDASARTPEQVSFLSKVNPQEIKVAISQRKARASKISPQAASQTNIGRFPGCNFPNKGKVKGLVILVNYFDHKFNLSDPYSYFNNMLNQRGFNEYSGTGSALDYFIENSNGQFTPQFDVYGPVTLPRTRSYYGGNDSYGNDLRPEEMIIDACNMLDSTVDFSQYDCDGDGYVDNVYVFYAGQGEASYGSSDTVWPHQWECSSGKGSITLDGVVIDRYACSNEWEKNRPDGIGTFVHEFSHVMGLPDLYSTSGTSTATPGEYSVLDYGPYNNDGRTPPAYSAFERNALGWTQPRVISGPAAITLEDIKDSNEVCLIPTSKNNEFFLLENRQQTGWDRYIPGHGMLVWHIDFNATKWMNNAVNNTSSHQYVDIEEAIGKYDNSSATTMAGYPFPGTKNITSFTDDTKPSMKTWSGQALNLPITEIKEENGVISFLVAGGVSLDTPVLNEPRDITASSFRASWDAVDGATDYLLTVRTFVEAEKGSETCGFGENTTLSLNDGWTSNVGATGVYYSLNNYGAAKPSLKLSNNGHFVMTKVYDADITSISFWAKGMNQTSNPLSIYRVDNGVESLLGSIDSWKSTGAIFTFNIPQSGVRQLKLVYDKGSASGNLGIDDLTVNYGEDSSQIVPGYNAKSTSGATSVIVSNLIDGVTKYTYTVTAADASGTTSHESASMFVELLGSGLTGDVNGDGYVNTADITAIIEMMFGNSADTRKGDLNGDGAVDVKDISQLIGIILGN